MLNKFASFFFRDTLALYPDDVPSTLDYAARVQRTDPMNERFTESSAVRHVVNLSHDRSGYLKIENVEIPNETADTFSIVDVPSATDASTTGFEASEGDSARS